MPWMLSAFADEAGPSCDDQIKALNAAGYHYIDIRGMDGFNCTNMPVDHAKNVRKKLDDAGIRVNMYGSPIGKIDLADDLNTDLDKLRHLATLAPVLGCHSVRMFSFYNKKAALPHAEFTKQALDRLHKLKALAKELGLVLYHENESHIFGDKAADVLTIAKELRDANGKGTFRMIFDFGNYNAGKEDVWANWLLLRDLTDAIHFKDNAWTDTPDGQKLAHVPVGQGGGRVKDIIQDAQKRGWVGPLTLEPHLKHSAAVVATGPSGVANQAYSAMTEFESFQLAAKAAKDICLNAGAQLA